MLAAADRFLLLNALRAFWLGFFAAGFLAYPTVQALIKFKSRQVVSQYAPATHQQKQGTPTMGGIFIVFAGIVVLGAFASYGLFMEVGVYLTVLLGFAFVGFTDDFLVPRLMPGKRGLGWKQKIAMQLVVAIVAMAVQGRGISWVGAVTVFLILFFSNAYNFADGLDGLAATIGILFFGGICVIGAMAGYVYSAPVFAASLAGALIPFLVLNSPPAKVFMGDVGSLPLGGVMGLMVSQLVLPFASAQEFNPGSPWFRGRPLMAYEVAGHLVVPAVGVALLVMSLLLVAELVPVPLQIASVKLRGKKLFLSTPIHHGFEARGWPESRVVWRFAIAQLLLCVLAVCIVFAPASGSLRDGPGIRTAQRGP